VTAGSELVAELAEVDELCDLRFADDQLRTVLDLAIVVGEPVAQRIARVVGPLDDVDVLLLDAIENPHRARALALCMQQDWIAACS
jgi:hypothetical protein